MDTVTMAIMAAISAGIISGSTDAAKKAVLDAYEALKSMIGHKHEGVKKAIDELEKNPDSSGRREVLKEEVEKANVNLDKELLQLAQNVLSNVKSMPDGSKYIQIAKGNYIAQADRGGTATVKVKNTKR